MTSWYCHHMRKKVRIFCFVSQLLPFFILFHFFHSFFFAFLPPFPSVFLLPFLHFRRSHHGGLYSRLTPAAQTGLTWALAELVLQTQVTWPALYVCCCCCCCCWAYELRLSTCIQCHSAWTETHCFPTASSFSLPNTLLPWALEGILMLCCASFITILMRTRVKWESSSPYGFHWWQGV